MPRSALPCLLALVAAPAFAQTSSNAEPLAAEAALEAAQSAGDRAALERLLAPDFLAAQGSGKVVGKADYVEGFANAGTKLETAVIGDRLFLRVSPDVAIAGGEARTSGLYEGRRFTAHYRFAHTFVRRADRWQAIYAQVTPLAE